jgi:hypothetical protein
MLPIDQPGRGAMQARKNSCSNPVLHAPPPDSEKNGFFISNAAAMMHYCKPINLTQINRFKIALRYA